MPRWIDDDDVDDDDDEDDLNFSGRPVTIIEKEKSFVSYVYLNIDFRLQILHCV